MTSPLEVNAIESGGDARDASARAPLTVVRYTPTLRSAWNDFIAQAKNATFLFHRDYLEYHADRFVDSSLMVYQGDRLAAVLPANRAEDVLVSHGGLTYGGLVVPRDAGLEDVAWSFRAVLQWAASEGMSTLRYKRIPRVYSAVPDDEIDYVHFLVGATLSRRDVSTAIEIGPRALPYQRNRRTSVTTARRRGCSVEPVTDFAPFWNEVLRPTLMARYGVEPVHSLAEITMLASRFPDNIRQFNVTDGGSVVAGATVFVTDSVAHTQYLAVTDAGRRQRALDLLMDELIVKHFAQKRYFDFGTSNEQNGRAVNLGLHRWKEGFGARAVVHDFCDIETRKYADIDRAFLGTA